MNTKPIITFPQHFELDALALAQMQAAITGKTSVRLNFEFLPDARQAAAIAEQLAGKPAFIRGAIESVDTSGWISGWAAQEGVTVQFFVDDEFVASCVSNLPRPDIAGLNPHFGPNCGFRLLLPESVADVHDSLKMICSPDEFVDPFRLWVPPPAVAAWQPGPPFEGNLESAAADGTVVGWAYAPSQPDKPAGVSFALDGVDIGSVVASRFRSDLLSAGKGNGLHGFVFMVAPELLTPGDHILSATLPGSTTTALAGSPLTITGAPPAA